MSFKAIVLNKDGENFTREVKEVEKSFLTHGNVLVKVDYSSLNFKDGMILKNGGNLVKDYPHIPGIDFAGTVEESESGKFKKGDKVILTGWRVGEVFFGGYSQYAKVQDDFLVKMPNDLDSKKAMILGTAGLTALMCVLAIQARETILLGEPIKDVLVTGATGGVGSVAVLALSKLGYNVSAVTGKKDKSGFLKENAIAWINASTGEKQNEDAFKIVDSWIVRQFENEYNPLHWHGGHISGVGYLKVPKNLGETFQTGKSLNQNGKLQLVHGTKMFLSPSTFTITPKIGEFYFFPNYLMHSVYPFINSKEERRSISFNAYIDEKSYNVYGN